MKTYRGSRQRDGRLWKAVVKVLEGDSWRPLHHVCVHSPDGFEWGYGGSGPADLALSIVCDHLSPDFQIDPSDFNLFGNNEIATRAWALHQKFKFRVVAGFDVEWQLPESEVARIIAGLEG